METDLNYPKEEFKKELNYYINLGQDLIEKYNSTLITIKEFERVSREYNFWQKEIEEWLNVRFDSLFGNEYLQAFKETNKYNINGFAKLLSGENLNNLESKHNLLKESCQEKIDTLITLDRKLKFINVNEINSDIIIENIEKKEKKIFISHSSLDSKYVEKIIDVLEVIGVPNEKIFCSSFEGYGVKLGHDFLVQIKKELNNQVFVIFILSDNFYSSAVSLCEMGATWVKTNKHLPILIPPFDYKEVKGVIPTTHGMKINEKVKYNSLKEIFEVFLELTPLNITIWERKRDNILKDIKKLLDNSNVTSTLSNSDNKDSNDDFYDNLDNIIKENSKKEWGNDFVMQLDYIERQKKAIEKLKNHKPIDIDLNDFTIIRQNSRKEWGNDFEMQLDYEQRQLESLRRLNKL